MGLVISFSAPCVTVILSTVHKAGGTANANGKAHQDVQPEVPATVTRGRTWFEMSLFCHTSSM